MEGKIRELLGNERKFMWSPVANVTVVTRVRGKITLDELGDAVNALKPRHVLLSCKIVFDMQHEKAWFSGDNVRAIPIRKIEGGHDKQWLDEALSEYRKPFDLLHGPLIRFVLVQFSDFVDLIVYAQHCICDGTALVHLTGDILERISQPDKEVRSCPLPTPLSPETLPESVAPSGLMAKLQEKGVGAINKGWRKSSIVFDQQDYESIQQAYWNNFEYRILFMELDALQTKNLLERCRAHGVTVNSALCAAFIGAYQKFRGGFKGAKKNVAIPVDLRNRMEPKVEGVLSLYVGSLNFPYKYNKRKMFWDNARAFHDLVTKKMEKQNLFETFFALEAMDHTLLEAMLTFAATAKYVQPGSNRYAKLSRFAHDGKNQANKMCKRFVSNLPGTVMTNLGKANIPEDYGNLKIEKMHFLPSTSESFPLALGVITAGGQLSLTVNYVHQCRENELKQIVAEAKRLLEIL